MITIVKESKLNSVDKLGIFEFVSISKDDLDGVDRKLDLLRPTDDIIIKKKEKNISKKQFSKSYKKWLKNIGVQFQIFSLVNEIHLGKNVCLVATDEDFELGYLKILGKYVSKTYGVDFYKSAKEASKALDEVMCDLSKKERKLIKADPEELGEKKQKFRRNLIKDIMKSIGAGMSEDGKDEFKKLISRFAPYCTANCMVESKAIMISEDDEVSTDANACEFKPKELIKIILKSEEDKFAYRIVKGILSAHQIKLKKKALKDLDKESLVTIFAEIYVVYTKEMYNLAD